MSKHLTHNSVRLQKLTTFRIGGRPVWYERPRGYLELEAALRHCQERGLPFRIMGGASNVLADDGHLPFAVIHICSPGFNWIVRVNATTLRVGSGVRMGRLLAYCRDEGLGGLEFLAGVPGTVGGALAGNAGAWGSSIGKHLARACIFEPSRGKVIRPASQVDFEYRASGLAGQIITEAVFELQPRLPDLIRGLMEHFTADKARVHPIGARSAGCVFKNPPHQSAGKLLDLCGMKGKRIGGAEVSRLHANFICNVADATSGNVLELIETMRTAVRRKFTVELELEINHWSSQAKVA